MAVKAEELLRFANSLASNDDELSNRTSVSRAYYAAYHAILPVAAALPATSKELEDATYVGHSEAIKRLVEWRTSIPGLSRMKGNAAIAARQLRACKSLRELADYHLHCELDSHRTRDHLNRARSILQFGVRAKHELDRQQVA